MNRVLATAFPAFSCHARPKSYYSYPEGSTKSSVIFRVVYPGKEPIAKGRVLLFFAPSEAPEPRLEALELDTPKPMFAKDISGVQPGDTIEFDSTDYSVPDALSFVPKDLSIFASKLCVQALISQDLNDPDPNSRVGNHYSKPIVVTLEPGGKESKVVVNIVADQVITDTMDLSSNEWMECVEMKSELLSQYHQQDVFMYAAVVFPKGYTSRAEDTNFPTVYYIEGFTGTESYADRARAFLGSEMGDTWKAGEWAAPMIRVTLGSRFKFGHTSFADTEVNGPWGTALVSEFIPFLESKFAMIAASTGRALHGHSSGGWSTLWLQLQFPQFFGGTWSTAPDPVDFTKFQVVNIYEADNMYWDASGNPYPTSRFEGEVTCSIRDENLLERVFAPGNGGQWDAFFAVFGPRDSKTGMPIPLYDKVSGAIDRDVAKYWARYDICKLWRQRGAQLAPLLVDKIHVICGCEDNYNLNTACESLLGLIGAKKQSNAATLENYVDIVPGDHTTIRNRRHYQLIYEEIAMAFRRHNVSM